MYDLKCNKEKTGLPRVEFKQLLNHAFAKYALADILLAEKAIILYPLLFIKIMKWETQF